MLRTTMTRTFTLPWSKIRINPPGHRLEILKTAQSVNNRLLWCVILSGPSSAS
jgi:hypothetical protein